MAAIEAPEMLRAYGRVPRVWGLFRDAIQKANLNTLRGDEQPVIVKPTMVSLVEMKDMMVGTPLCRCSLGLDHGYSISFKRE